MTGAPGRVHLVAISHLDTQWRWTAADTFSRFLPRTLVDTFRAFAGHPSYRVNFDGAYRYERARELYPDLWEELRRQVAAGRWCVAGATWEAPDVNVPSPESLVRHVLYGRRFFRRELGRDPRDLFLPDCFGFGAQVPTVAAHCGLVGFATSKLSRRGVLRSSVDLPFPLGVWEGLDGAGIVAVLRPGGYGEPLERLPADDAEVLAQLDEQERLGGGRRCVRFFGVGDRGGVPTEESLDMLERAVADPRLATDCASSDELLRDLAAGAGELPRWRGELLLTTHGPGCYTAKADAKRWNRHLEHLAEAAEKAASAAGWLGLPYPAAELREAWKLVLAHQFHDDLTGTSIPAAYRITADELGEAASRFEEVLRRSVAAVAGGLDTAVDGVPLVVFNPLSFERCDVLEATVPLAPEAGVRAFDGEGREIACQLLAAVGAGACRIALAPTVPPIGFAVVALRAGAGARAAASDLRVDLPGSLAGERLALEIDAAGDLARVTDLVAGRELLSGPTHLELLPDRSLKYPAWEILWRDVAHPPLAEVGGPATVRVVERGPVRVAIEVERRQGPNRFVERYALGDGRAGDHVAVTVRIDWRQAGRLLKLSLPLAVEEPRALFDVGLGAVERGVAGPRLHEVPAQGWAGLVSGSGTAGVAVLSASRHGWDRPEPSRLRLTLLHAPGTVRRFPHQRWQDWGEHRLAWGLAPFPAGEPAAASRLAARLAQPLLPFVAPPGPGRLGRSWSFLAVDGPGASARAVKRAEEDDELVVRLVETAGAPGPVTLRLPAAIEGARELDGCEDPLGALSPGGDRLTVALEPHRPFTLGLRLAPPSDPSPPPAAAQVPLPLDVAAVSPQGGRSPGGIDRQGRALPAELWPERLALGHLEVRLAAADGATALACRGQRLGLPPGEWTLLWLVAARRDRAAIATAVLASGERPLRVPAASAPLAGWQERPPLWHLALGHRRRRAFREPASLAWTASHLHDGRGRDLPSRRGRLFLVTLPLAAGDDWLRLPDDPDLLLFAAAAVADPREPTAWAGEVFR